MPCVFGRCARKIIVVWDFRFSRPCVWKWCLLGCNNMSTRNYQQQLHGVTFPKTTIVILFVPQASVPTDSPWVLIYMQPLYVWRQPVVFTSYGWWIYMILEESESSWPMTLHGWPLEAAGHTIHTKCSKSSVRFTFQLLAKINDFIKGKVWATLNKWRKCK